MPCLPSHVGSSSQCSVPCLRVLQQSDLGGLSQLPAGPKPRPKLTPSPVAPWPVGLIPRGLSQVQEAGRTPLPGSSLYCLLSSRQ